MRRSPSLYKVNAQIARLYAIDDDTMVDEETGEVFDKEAFDALKMTRTRKIENTIAYMKNRLANAKALKEEAEEILKRAKAFEREAERARAGLQYCLEPGEKFDGKKGAIRWRKSQAVAIDVAVEELPTEFLKFTATAKKAEITKAIKAGETVPGARLEDRISLIVK